MKLFLTCFCAFLPLFSAYAEDSKVVIPDNLKIDRLKLQVKAARLIDQSRQLATAQQDVAKQYTDLQPVINKSTDALKAFCESKSQVFTENVDEFSCEPKKDEKKDKEVKK